MGGKLRRAQKNPVSEVVRLLTSEIASTRTQEYPGECRLRCRRGLLLVPQSKPTRSQSNDHPDISDDLAVFADALTRLNRCYRRCGIAQQHKQHCDDQLRQDIDDTCTRKYGPHKKKHRMRQLQECVQKGDMLVHDTRRDCTGYLLQQRHACQCIGDRSSDDFRRPPVSFPDSENLN
ncbi:MAG: hypothetical protein MHM6MM_007695 [Cercozoa sp. M6MM]